MIPTTTPEPSVVFLALWPGATDDVVRSHATSYKTKYPGTRIETLTSSNDISLLVDREKGEIQCYGNDDSVLIHIFGHAAAARVCSFLRAHYARNGKALNVQQLIFDSAPISFLARTFSKPYQMLVSACYWICAPVLQSDALYDDGSWIKQDLESSYLLPARVKRHYVLHSGDAASHGDHDSGMESGMHFLQAKGWPKTRHISPDCSMPSWWAV